MDTPMFSSQVGDLLFTDDYRATRCWPAKQSRNTKIKMPEEMDRFLQTYVTRHVKDQMAREQFWGK